MSRLPTHAPCSVMLAVALTVPVAPLAAQELAARDSALVARILLAEDRRDSLGSAFADGLRHRDPRIQTLARRASERVHDPLFARRTALPPLPAPPVYADPAWRLRYRALARADCPTLRGALADSAWPVRLRAADLAASACAGDASAIGALVGWARLPVASSVRARGSISWHAAAHAIVALAHLAPDSARALLGPYSASPVPAVRAYAARAAGVLGDSGLLRRLAGGADDNVKEAAIDALAKSAGHAADDVYRVALRARGYQAVRAAARALMGTSQRDVTLASALAAASRLRADSSETSRDARLAVLALVGSVATPANARAVAAIATDFDCVVADSAAAIVARLRGAPGRRQRGRCARLPVTLPAGAVALALGSDVRIRVTLADASGGGAFTVRLRGDVAPIMSARVLALVRAHWYDGLTWHRVEPDFVIQGGGPGANEYVGHPRFIRDELGTVPHVRGTVGMSTRGHDTGDGQWFVNLRDNLRLGRDYTVFGEVVDGIDVVDGVLEGDVIARMEVVPDAPSPASQRRRR